MCTQSEVVQQCVRAVQAAPEDTQQLGELTAGILTFRATSSGLMEVLDEFLHTALAREEVCVYMAAQPGVMVYRCAGLEAQVRPRCREEKACRAEVDGRAGVGTEAQFGQAVQ